MIDQKLAAMGLELLKVWIRDFHVSGLFKSKSSIAIQIERAPIPCCVFVRNVPEDAQINRSGVGCTVKGRNRPVCFTTGHQAWVDQLASAFLRGLVRHLYCLKLGGCQATLILRSPTQERRRIEVTFHRIGQESVFYAVQFVACLQHSSIEEEHFATRNDPSRILSNRCVQIDSPGAQLELIVCGCSSDDAVEILGISDGLHNPLTATG